MKKRFQLKRRKGKNLRYPLVVIDTTTGAVCEQYLATSPLSARNACDRLNRLSASADDAKTIQEAPDGGIERLDANG